MELSLPDNIVAGLNLTQDEWKLELALGLYIGNRISLGKAAELAGISKPHFFDELGKRRLPVDYDIEDLDSDLATIAFIRDACIKC